MLGLLWIAFKLYFYIGLWQLWVTNSVFPNSCELLSNCIFISVFDNWSRLAWLPISLWIAFKLYFYIGLWQRGGDMTIAIASCELLSNCIFISVFDNYRCKYLEQLPVVNCFQIVFLYRSLTTCKCLWPVKRRLWIAFKLYFYIGLWQLYCKSASTT